MTAQTPDRFRADRPVPKPGIIDIEPYKPGKAKAEGVENPVKLSANENVLGSSPLAQEAFAAAAGPCATFHADCHSTLMRWPMPSHFGSGGQHEVDRRSAGAGRSLVPPAD